MRVMITMGDDNDDDDDDDDEGDDDVHDDVRDDDNGEGDDDNDGGDSTWVLHVRASCGASEVGRDWEPSPRGAPWGALSAVADSARKELPDVLRVAPKHV